uniref:Uncharacterized protein n=2 Tax=Nonomuraea gerenzanensis TaxID=93944 RepID=A0A1M4EDY2_9ACTN|nr:hypothetical protein BN4615_P6641 [Nonomuraea gerenzanensis]
MALAAAGLVVAVTPVAHADRGTSYLRAAAIIDANGRLNSEKNVDKSWRAGVGQYCVQVDHHIKVSRSLILLTPRHARRLPHIAYRNPSSTCSRQNTITVNVYDTNTGHLADGGFDLAVF